MDRIDAGWRSWTNEKSLWHRACLHPAFVEGLCPAPYGVPVHSLAALAPGDPQRTNDHLEPPKGAAAGITGRVAAGARWPGRTEIPRFRRWAWVCHLGGPFRCKHSQAPETWTWSTRSEGKRTTCSAATSTETRLRGTNDHDLDMRTSCFVWCQERSGGHCDRLLLVYGKD